MEEERAALIDGCVQIMTSVCVCLFVLCLLGYLYVDRRVGVHERLSWCVIGALANVCFSHTDCGNVCIYLYECLGWYFR